LQFGEVGDLAEDRRPELLEEYRSLREEMLNRAKRADDVLVYSIIGTAALLGYGFTLKVSYIFSSSFLDYHSLERLH